MGVNLGSITSKLNSYVKSPAGKSRIQETIKSYARGDSHYVNTTGRTLSGDRMITQQEMRDVARELVFYIKQAAASCDLPNSVMDHIESFDIVTASEESDDFYYIGLSMTDNARRESVQPEKYDGVDNIVALLNTGYPKDGRSVGRVFGYWKTADKDIWTLPQREGLRFIQQAIDRFNSTYAKEYNVTVFLSSEYE